VPLSFRLHAELAAEHDGATRWGYRRVQCGCIQAKAQSPTKIVTVSGGAAEEKAEWQKLPKVGDGVKVRGLVEKGVPEDLDWFIPEAVTAYASMGEPDTTAQVHPLQFTTAMAELAQEKGVEIKVGAHVDSIDYTGGRVKSVTYTDKHTHQTHTILASDVVVAAGPWSSHIYPDVEIDALRAHSVTIKADVSPYAVFSEIDLPSDFTGADGKGKKHGKTVTPEMYARPNGEVYACGQSSPPSRSLDTNVLTSPGEGDTLIPLPKTADLVQCDEARCQDVIDYVSSISRELAAGEVLAKQACYLPSVAGGGGPVIGHTGVEGLLLATGHTCWGIQNSCATGQLVSEFVFDGEAKSASIPSLDPRKYV